MALIKSSLLQSGGIDLSDVREIASGYFSYGQTDLTSAYYKNTVLDSGSAVCSRDQSNKAIVASADCKAIVINQTLGSGSGTVTVSDFTSGDAFATFANQAGPQFITVLVLNS